MKSVRISLLCLAVAAISACSSTPIPPIISAPLAVQSKPLPPPPPEPLPPPAETFAITMGAASSVADDSNRDGNGGNGGNNKNNNNDNSTGSQPALADARVRLADESARPSSTPIRMGLLLPLRSETLGAAADALRAGFMAAWERDRDNIFITVLETGDVPQDILSSYARALQDEDIIVGPLSRSAVATVAGSPLVSKPTVVLNYPEGHGLPGAAPLPDNILAMGLSIEEEARQAALWAAAENPNSSALILTTSTPWQRRVAAAFANQWQRLGFAVRLVELSAPDGYLSDPELVQLRARLRQDMPGLLFSAMGADQTRQLRAALGSPVTTEPTNPIFSTADALPPPPAAPTEQFSGLQIYGTSALNPGQELDGVRLLDLPWQIQRDHPAVMVYPHPVQAGSPDMERLYALGIDAYRVAREIARHPAGRFHLDGVTGRLTIDFGRGPASFERIEPTAVYKNGVPQVVGP